MTKNQIFKRLVSLAQMPGSGSGSPVVMADMVNQDQLGDFQEKLTLLLADVANDREVNGGVLLETVFPRLFKADKAP